LDYYGLLEEEGIAIIREFKKDLKWSMWENWQKI
jgi:hypothetical protein